MSAEKMLAAARSDLGMRGRPNEITRDYAKRHGNAFLKAAWCNMGVTKWARDSGNAAAVLPKGDRAYTVWHAQDFFQAGRWYPGTTENLKKAKPGDIVFFDWSGSNNIGYIDHVGIIEKVRSDGTIVTIEANTGDAVLRKVRDCTTVAGYGRPAYSDTPTLPPVVSAPESAKGDLGVDYAWSRPRPDVLKREGYRFACRYLSNDKSKDLSKSEAKALAACGIASVVVWETKADRANDGFAAGNHDAQAAAEKAKDAGMNSSRPIYFAVDWDASPNALAMGVTEYFKGIRSVLPLDRIGVYGGYKSVKFLVEAGLAKWSWQTYAWSGGQWYSGNHIEQYKIETKVDGKDVDLNRAMAVDIGQWFPDVGGAPKGRKPAPKPKPRYWRFKIKSGKQYTVPWGSPVIRDGDRGTRVKWLQESLNLVLGGKDLKVDGEFGPKTESALRRFQSDSKSKDAKGRRLAVDGEYGNNSADALYLRAKGM